MSQTKAKKQYLKLGAMCQRKENGKDGKPAYYLKLEKDVEITVKGVKYTGQYVNVQRPEERLAGVLKSQKMSEAEYNTAIERYGKEGDLNFVKFEFVAVKED